MPSARDRYYNYIVEKMSSIKSVFPSLQGQTDPYVFSALCLKSNLFKNPALSLSDDDLAEMVVDSQFDGGVDILLTDPNSEASDFIIGQSKFYKTISSEDVLNALMKMARFYENMESGHYEQVNSVVQRRYLTLISEVGEESKIHFVFYTSALQGSIRKENIEKKFKEQFLDSNNIEVSLYFGKDIEAEIKESESRRPTVEIGKIKIDKAGNYLTYGDDAIIVNISAFSIKQLYAQYNTNLLARNLR